MVKPPTSGRSSKVLDGVSGGASIAYSQPIDDLLLFNEIMIYLNNQHASQTVDFLIQATVFRGDTTNAEWETIYAQTTLAASTSLVLSSDDISELQKPWDAIRVGYVRTDGSNLGTLYAWVNRK